MTTVPNIRSTFKAQNIKTKGLTLLIEHAPCCLLSFAAASLGIEVLNHNPWLELGVAVGGALIGEYIGHKFFHKNCQHDNTLRDNAKRYGLSLLFGLSSWGIHQAVFHDHSTHNHDNQCMTEACDNPHHTHHNHPHDDNCNPTDTVTYHLSWKPH